MHLLIRAVSLAGQPLTQAISAYFDERGGTIGRSDTNTLALPDPERRISRLQAEVTLAEGGWRILNVGSANPIWHNNRPLPPGESALLDEGDELQVGTYALQVTQMQDDDTAHAITRGRAVADSRTVILGSKQEPKTDAGLMRSQAIVSPGDSAGKAAVSPAVQPAASPFADLLGTGGSLSAQAPGASLVSPGGVSPSSPFADLLGPGVSGPAATASASAPGVARLPDDFDPFADPLTQPPRPARSGSASAAPPGAWDLPTPKGTLQSTPAKIRPSPFDTTPTGTTVPGALDPLAHLTPGGPPSIDQMFGLASSAAPADPLAAFLQQTAPQGAAAQPGAPSSLDPLALLSPAGAPASTEQPPSGQGAAPLPDHVPALHGAMSLPPVVPASFTAPGATTPLQQGGSDGLRTLAPSFPVQAAAASETEATTVPDVHQSTLMPEEVSIDLDLPMARPLVREADNPAAPQRPTAVAPDVQALWSAFCEGAGTRFTPPQGLTPELMRTIGGLLRHAVGGSLKLVAARAMTKQEMRAEVTMIQARGNNPLKFSPDTEAALQQLLQPPLRGFMSGPDAIADAMDDLLGHTIGTMAGMRAALEGVLTRFEPAQLEAKLVGRSMLDSLLPMNRRARLWELYLQHYQTVREEAQEDFHSLFGKAFVQAYEEQLDRLDAERRGQPLQRRDEGPASRRA